MRILITNDDGIYSPGIAALAHVAARFGEVRIVAPDVEQSSAGHAVTHTHPLSYRPAPIDGFEAYRVNGTPADCVALGTHNWDKVDLVLSGINLGTNLGNSCWGSGTLAAAKQAALLGLRGIAFSTPIGDTEPDFDALTPWIEQILRALIDTPELCLVNVNLPQQPAGVRWTRLSVRHYDGQIVPGKDPSGRPHFWFTVTPVEVTEPGTDRWAFEQGFATITPIRLDLTDHDALQAVQARVPLG